MTDYRVGLRSMVEMDHVEASVLQGVAELHREVFTALTRYCERHDDFLDETIRRFDREVQLNLHERLAPKGEPVCIALPALASGGALSARGALRRLLELEPGRRGGRQQAGAPPVDHDGGRAMRLAPTVAVGR